jgi:hypothetical protein
MTPSELAQRALPTVQRALTAAQPEIKQAVGRGKWAILWPTWMILTGSGPLAILIRVAVELAIGYLAPLVGPLLSDLEPLAERLLRDPADVRTFRDVVGLLRTPTYQLSEPARQALRRP